MATKGKLSMIRATVVMGLLLGMGGGLGPWGLPEAQSLPQAGTNGRIVFTANRNGHQQIYSANKGGGDLKQLTHASGNVVVEFPAYSPEGNKIVFDSNQSGNFEIYVMQVDGTGVKPLTTEAGVDHFKPDISPDGTKVAFVRCTGELICAIDVMNVDGTGRFDLTGYEDNFWPSWSPDGSQIAFDIFNHNGVRLAVYLVNADGSGTPRRLTPTNLEAGASDWGPSGAQLVVQSHGDSEHSSLYLINADGTGLTRLTFPTGVHNDWSAHFSPDGTKVLFGSDRNYPALDGADLFTINVDGTGAAQLISNLFPGGCPCLTTIDWGPR
jgi:Tol biopolymer transport system component